VSSPVNIYYGYGATEAGYFQVTQPAYTLTVTGLPSTAVPARDASVTFTVTTNAPDYTLKMMAGDDVLATVSGLPTDGGVTGSPPPGSWIKSHTVSVPNNSSTTADRTIIMWIREKFKDVGSFVQKHRMPYYVGGPVTMVEPGWTNVTCADGYAIWNTGLLSTYSLSGVDFSWVTETWAVYAENQVTDGVGFQYGAIRSSTEGMSNAPLGKNGVPTGVNLGFNLYWLCERQ
jgi:hypothetical protein